MNQILETNEIESIVLTTISSSLTSTKKSLPPERKALEENIVFIIEDEAVLALVNYIITNIARIDVARRLKKRLEGMDEVLSVLTSVHEEEDYLERLRKITRDYFEIVGVKHTSTDFTRLIQEGITHYLRRATHAQIFH